MRIIGWTFLLLIGCGEPQAGSDEGASETSTPGVEMALQGLDNSSLVNEEHACLTKAPGEIQWHSCNGPNSVQFGLPGSDLRGVRMDCVDSELSMAFAIPSNEEPRELVIVDFPNGQQLQGEEIQLGDGLNAWVRFDDADQLALDFVAGEYFEFSFEGELYSFPVAEGQRLVENLVAAC